MLALLAVARSIDPLIQQALAAIGEARMNLQNAIMTVCILPVAFFFAAGGWGINGVAVAWLLLGPLLFSRLLFRALRRIELPRRQYFAALWPAVSGCLVMSIAVIAVQRSGVASRSLYFSLAVQVATGAVTYVAALFVLHRNRLVQLRNIIAVLRSRKAVAGQPAPPVPAPTA
jgi:hypothetical protein